MTKDQRNPDRGERAARGRVIRRDGRGTRTLPPELEAFARSDDKRLPPRERPEGLRDPRAAALVPGVSNHDARIVHDRRVAALRASGEYAAQIMAGLADGVAVVDARDRIEFANDPFLDLVGVEPAVLHRMPADAAVPIPGLRELLDTARSSVVGRGTVVHALGARTLRVAALRLDATPGRRGPMVALVVDDISDALLANDQLAREGHRLEHVLDAVEAFVWEADADSLLLLAVSHSAERLTGVRDVDLLGRARFIDVVHTDDVRSVLVACSELRPGERADLVHRIVCADGSVRRVRSSVVAAFARPGETTISGVTIEVPAPATVEPG